MQSGSRHQCLIYEGPPTRHLSALAANVRKKLALNYRCIYINSAPMIAGMRSYLAAAGVDVLGETAKTSLVFSQKQHAGADGSFDPDEMIAALGEALEQALYDGYEGLWATGDMAWEFGAARNFSKLLEYEQRLEEFFRKNPEISGVCQYHADQLPREMLRQGILTHSTMFVNETLSLINPYYLPHPQHGDQAAPNEASMEQLDVAIRQFCR